MPTPSEQESELELGGEPPMEEPLAWQADDPDVADVGGKDAAGQLTAPGGGGAPGDEEPTEIAEPAGEAYPGGPEQQAVRVDEEL